jgi:NAD+ diphosphatase
LPPEAYFAGPGLDRADLLRGDAEALANLASRDDARQLVWRDGLPGITGDGQLEFGELSDPALFLGLAGGAPIFASVPPRVENAWAAFQLLGALAPDQAPVFAAALSLGGWHLRHRFCANCGNPSEIVRGGWSRCCWNCAAEHFPRVDPVVIMLAEHDGHVLLGRQPHYPPGRYSALAGFLEVGETIEDAVRRELGEEAGIVTGEVTYVTSQPWPFPSSLMIGCMAAANGAELTVDTTELDDARWFTWAEVEAALKHADDAPFQPPPRFAIARTLLEHWVRLEVGQSRP